jgi:hypothetical protein
VEGCASIVRSRASRLTRRGPDLRATKPIHSQART